MEHIPKSIHLISVGNFPLSKYSHFVERIKTLHPSWSINIWDDASTLSLVQEHFPDWVEAYNSYRMPVQRADIFRIMIIYLRGGFYLDLDMFCLKKLDDLCGKEMVLGIEKILPADECARLNHQYPVRVGSYMFGSRPGHGLWLDFLDAAKSKSAGNIALEDDVLETTGPGLLTNVFHEAKYKYDNIVLLTNRDKACPKSCGQASCHFGDYAVHYHAGSWRWESVKG
jgi:mannosyltransferase OCH1-like enzyme